MRFFRRLVALFLLVLGGFIGWYGRGLLGPVRSTSGPAPVAVASAPQASGIPRLLEGVPDVRQSTAYSCGAAALQAVMLYYGIEEREDSLMRELKTNPDTGTSPGDILRVARASGLRAALREKLTFADLEAALGRGIPVIADIQAWKDEEGLVRPWTERWEDGHYVVVLGLDEASVYVEDPSLLGCRGVIPKKEFLDRWHDYEGPEPFGPKRRAYIRMGIFIEGRKPAPPRPFQRVD